MVRLPRRSRSRRLNPAADGGHAFALVPGVDVVVLVPTYNERHNLQSLLAGILRHDVRVLVIDDASPDGTGMLADELVPCYPGRLEVLHRRAKEGLGPAYVAGMRWALAQRPDFICQMDGDHSHNPADLPRLIEAAHGADLAIGSRYVAGGAVAGWALRRRLLSRYANHYVRLVTAMPVADCTAGFRCWTRAALQAIDLDSVGASGYAFLVETLHCAVRCGLHVVELPITFTERTTGASKMDFAVIAEAVTAPWRFRMPRRRLTTLHLRPPATVTPSPSLTVAPAAAAVPGRRGLVLLGGAAIWGALVYSQAVDVHLDRLQLLDGPVWPLVAGRAAFHDAVLNLAAALAVLLAAWSTGSVVARALRTPCDLPLERVVFTLAYGFAVIACASVMLAFAGVYTEPVVRAAIAAAAIGGIALVPWRGAAGLGWRSIRRLPGVPVVLIACAILLAFIGALAPEIEYDALWYHLWLPQRWLEAGSAVDIVDEYISLYPLSWEMAYGAALALGGPGAAKLLHFACLPLLAAVTALLTRELFPRARGAWGAAFAVTSPIVIWEATTAYVDLALAFYACASVYALLVFSRTRVIGWLVAAAVVMGAALAIKHLALVIAAAAGATFMASELASGHKLRSVLRHGALFAAVAVVPPLPWYIRAYAASGNPVFPDLYAVFGAAPDERWSWHSEQGLQRFKDDFGRPRTARSLAMLPWDATVHASAYAGTLGPAFLALVPLAFARRGRRTMAVACGCGVYLAVWASPISSFQMRFLIPLVPVGAAYAAEAIARLQRAAAERHARGSGVVSAATLCLLLLNLPPLIAWQEPDRQGWEGWLRHVMRAVPIGVVAGAEPPDDYLARHVPAYRAWQFIDRSLPSGAKVLTFFSGDQLYSRQPRVWSDAASIRSLTWGMPAREGTSFATRARAAGVTHVLVDRRQVDSGLLATIAIGAALGQSSGLTLLYEDARTRVYAVR